MSIALATVEAVQKSQKKHTQTVELWNLQFRDHTMHKRLPANTTGCYKADTA